MNKFLSISTLVLTTLTANLFAKAPNYADVRNHTEKYIPSLSSKVRTAIAARTEQLDSIIISDTAKMICTYEVLSNGDLATYLTMYTLIGDIWHKDIEEVQDIQDSHGNILSLMYTTDGTEWLDDFKISFAYDSKNNMVSDTIFEYTDGQWVYSGTRQYSYDSNGNRVLVLSSEWTGTEWLPFEKEESQYSGKALISSLTSIWDENEWFEMEKSEGTSTSDGKQLSITKYSFGGESEAWVASSKDEYSYEPNKTMIVTSNLRNDGWVISHKTETTTDEQGNQTAFARYSYNISDKSWKGLEHTSYTYDLATAKTNVAQPVMTQNSLYSKQLSATEYEWDLTTNSWVTGDISKFYYGKFVTPILKGKASPLQQFGFSQTHNTLNLKSNNSNPMSATIYTLSGREIGKYAFSATGSIDISSFARGSYILSCKIGGAVETLQFVKQ